MMAEKKTLAEKIMNSICKVNARSIKKLGKSYGWNYVEMKDIEPIINDVCQEERVLTLVSFPENKAVLSFIDIDSPSDVYTVEVTPNECKGTSKNPIQETGAMMSYMRRYLYLTAFHISENDIVDSYINNAPDQEEIKNAPIVSMDDVELKEQKRQELELIQDGSTTAMMKKKGVEHFTDLDMEYIDFCLNSLRERVAK